VLVAVVVEVELVVQAEMEIAVQLVLAESADVQHLVIAVQVEEVAHPQLLLREQ
jgi:hypothetical protein